MNSKLINVLAFIGGAAIGSFVTWQFVKDKYAKIADDEIESYKREWAVKNDALASDLAEAREYLKLNVGEEEATMEEINAYKSFASNYDYTNCADVTKEEPTNKYVIAPEEFGGEDDEYKQVSLTYYADNVLADDLGNVIVNIDELVGKDSLNTFGEYEDDSVYVRNEALEIDYEILLDPRKYSDVKFANSHPVDEDE